MRVAELYRSIQGEGLLTGTPSVFVRTSGCNLRCWFCDTPFASWTPEGDELAVDEVVTRVESLGTERVVLTGGEPMLWAELVPLAAQLRQRGKHITIETAGTLDLNVECDLMSISPKRANSTPAAATHPEWSARHERARHAPDVIRRLLADYAVQLKFVIDTPADVDDMQQYLTEFPTISPDQVWLMPQGVDRAALDARAAWLEPLARQLGYHYCPRRQIEWFGLQRGT